MIPTINMYCSFASEENRQSRGQNSLVDFREFGGPHQYLHREGRQCCRNRTAVWSRVHPCGEIARHFEVNVYARSQ